MLETWEDIIANKPVCHNHATRWLAFLLQSNPPQLHCRSVPTRIPLHVCSTVTLASSWRRCDLLSCHCSRQMESALCSNRLSCVCTVVTAAVVLFCRILLTRQVMTVYMLYVIMFDKSTRKKANIACYLMLGRDLHTVVITGWCYTGWFCLFLINSQCSFTFLICMKFARLQQ